jgi:hypothetical protein
MALAWLLALCRVLLPAVVTVVEEAKRRAAK